MCAFKIRLLCFVWHQIQIKNFGVTNVIAAVDVGVDVVVVLVGI